MERKAIDIEEELELLLFRQVAGIVSGLADTLAKLSGGSALEHEASLYESLATICEEKAQIAQEKARQA
jgi:hypothetical protein